MSAVDRGADLVEGIERMQVRLRRYAEGRDDEPTVRTAVAWTPVVAIGLLAMVVQFPHYARLFVADDVGLARGIGGVAFGLAAAVETLVVGLGALAIAASTGPLRRASVVWSSVSAVAATTALALSSNAVSVVVAVGVGGAGIAAYFALYLPYVLDAYRPSTWFRALSVLSGAWAAGMGVAALVVTQVPSSLRVTWRGALLALAAVGIVAVAVSGTRRLPDVRNDDRRRVGRLIDLHLGNAAANYDGRTDDEPAMPFVEGLRRVTLRPGSRALLSAFALLGFLVFPLHATLLRLFEGPWRFGDAGVGASFAAIAATQVTALALLARRGHAAHGAGPARLARYGSDVMLVGGFALMVAPFVPWRAVAVAVFGVTSAAVAIALVVMLLLLAVTIPPEARAHGGALAGILLIGAGGVGGLSFVDMVANRYGVDVALALLALPAAQLAVLLRRRIATSVGADADHVADEIVESEYVRSLARRGVHLPMLTCQQVSFSYGQLQVLFDVDFTVDDGELVALLGTNGAGKSTLLRVISGLGFPDSGTVRFGGRDVTFLDAEHRLRLGIVQIPGGRSVFGTMTVVENLRAFGHGLGRDRRALDRAIDECFDTFPRLAERRDLPAATLSGGERQMLGLSRALILQPRLLLIDELSLGLAPKVVGELLAIVRRMNALGTAIVLVEQSVNVALSLATDAYFMEKGEIRFSGASAELAERPDLLRSVFLEGAAQGLHHA